MTGRQPLIDIQGVLKRYTALRPLRIASLAVHPTDRLALSGFDAESAEMFVHLVTGAALADEGDVFVAGRNTREIRTDTEWLASLDRFGIVTERAVLLESLSVAANLALPITLAIDPIPDEVRRQVSDVAGLVGLAADRLDRPVASLTPEERVRVHLARAVAPRPFVVLLEHPTARLDGPESAARLGKTLDEFSRALGFGWIALTDDDAFAAAAGATRLRLVPSTGVLAPEGGRWRKWLGRR